SRRRRCTGGVRDRVQADLRDALLRRVARADTSGAGSRGGIARDVRRLRESITNRSVRWAVRRGRAAGCCREGQGTGCRAAPTTPASLRRRIVARCQIPRAVTLPDELSPRIRLWESPRETGARLGGYCTNL